MHVILSLPRAIPVHDHRDLGNIQSSTSDVGSNQHRDLSRSESSKRGKSLLLGEVGVKSDGGDLKFGEEGVDVSRRRASRGEDDGGWRPGRSFVFGRGGRFGSFGSRTRAISFAGGGGGGGRGGGFGKVWVGATEVEDGFGRVEEEVVEVGFSDVGWDEEVVLFESADGGSAGKRGKEGKRQKRTRRPR